MALTRRQLIAAGAGAAAAHAVLPAVARVGEAFGETRAAPHTRTRNRLVVIHLDGGNDGLNTVVPTSGRAYDVYRKVRPALAYKPSQTLRLTGNLGLNARLRTLHRLYRDDRVAIVQGVDYPDHSYSHFTSADVWHSGEPGRAATSGWLGRHLDRAGVGAGELRGVGIGRELPLMLRGTKTSGIEIASIASARFSDGTSAVAHARHDALALFGHHARDDALRRHLGLGARQAVDLVDVLGKVPAAKSTGNPLADAMLTARTLLGLDLGVEVVFVRAGGYDTHTEQKARHEQLLGTLDAALEAFFYGTSADRPVGAGGALPVRLASRTTVVVLSEFGRRIGENGTGGGAGTDHGASAPVFVIGPRGRIRHGLHGDTPPLGTAAAPADNLVMTTDVRRLYATLLDDWLHDPDPLYRRVPPLRLFR
jgi:uncharacterized protein (DUF1501 family)